MEILRTPDDDRLAGLLARGEFFWLHITAPSGLDLEQLGERFALHPLALEDTVEFGQRPKLDMYRETALLVFYGTDGSGLREVHLHISGQWMITVHEDGDDLLAPVMERLRLEPPRTEEEAIYRVIDQLTDSFFPVLEHIDDEIDALMDAMIERPSIDQREALFAMRRRLVELRRVVGPQRDVLARGGDLLGRLPGLEADDARDWFRDVYDHLLRISEQIDGYRDLLAGALDVYLSTVSNRLNQVTKQLTIIATIFLPLTFITGFFGQNFGFLVRHIDTPWAFWTFGVGSMVVGALVLWTWFKRSGFLED